MVLIITYSVPCNVMIYIVVFIVTSRLWISKLSLSYPFTKPAIESCTLWLADLEMDNYVLGQI